MRRRIVLNALIGTGAYLVFLLATVPAATAYGWLARDLGAIRLAGLQGTVWHGRAAEATFGGRSFGAVSWDMHVWALLLGRIAAAVSVSDPAASASADISVSFAGSLHVEDVDADLALARVADMVPALTGLASGRASLHLAELDIPASGAPSAKGRIVVTDLHLTWPQDIALGDYAADIDSESGALRARIRDASGPLGVQLVATVTRDGAYRVGGTLAAHSDAPDKLKDALNMLGKTDAGGRHAVDLAGSLPALRF